MLMLAAALISGSAQAETFALDPGPSRLYVIVRNDTSTLASRLGHDHAISAETFRGTVEWDVSDPTACKVDISFPITALQVDPGNLRAEAGLDPDGAVGDGAKKTIRGNFSKKNQLWADQFPEIRYRATSCSGTTGAIEVTGDLTIRGTAKRLTVPLTIDVNATSFRAQGRFKASHQDFGFKPFSNLAGALRNLPELEFVFDLQGRPAT